MRDFGLFYWINGAKKGRVDFEALALLKLSLLKAGNIKSKFIKAILFHMKT